MKAILLPVGFFVLAAFSFSALANDDAKLEESCKIMCEDIVKTFSAGMNENHQIMSCKQKGDIDGDANSLIEGMMACKVGYLGGEEQNDIKRIETFTITLNREDLN
ncbi:hypothetical protein [Thiothrix nivea]|uniref:Uncharacterized protein n=1 Tax=Thiothrix nivea (strain ATCC 35100 / DSM 5205 / JP2) TaxID=870187 RepID=A0A656HJ95_THINJ|nr:hypothetical protein [Thiothrix nivea]EIJ35075.1 hypothetical protein Thini_2532 [Thiothrix nivea DSM 5205]